MKNRFLNALLSDLTENDSNRSRNGLSSSFTRSGSEIVLLSNTGASFPFGASGEAAISVIFSLKGCAFLFPHTQNSVISLGVVTIASISYIRLTLRCDAAAEVSRDRISLRHSWRIKITPIKQVTSRRYRNLERAGTF
jgi:hypothetical protein